MTLPDTPRQARWLTHEDREAVLANRHLRISDDRPVGATRGMQWMALAIPYFGLVCGIDVISFWLPTLVSLQGVASQARIGFLSALPYAVATIAMVLAGRLSDRHGLRHGFFATLCCIGAVALMPLLIRTDGVLTILACASVSLSAFYGAYVVFWTLPAETPGVQATPVVFAMINAIGMIAGVLSPVIIGASHDWSGSFAPGILGTAVILFLSAGIIKRAAPTRIV